MMRKLFSPFLLATLMCFVGQTASALERDMSGAYLISNMDDMWEFTMLVRGGQTTSSAKLTADLDMSAVENWMPMGYFNHEVSNVFSGTFDGQGHVVRNFHLTPGEDQDFEPGFFGHVQRGTIRNLGFENARVSSAAAKNAGVLAASLYGARIENCYVCGDIQLQSESTELGAIAGIIDQTTIISNTYTSYPVLGTYPDEIEPRLRKAFCGPDIEKSAATGELCFMLNGDQSNILFRQTLGQDPYPVFGEIHSQVYATGQFSCDGTLQGTATYSNTPSANPIPAHEYDEDGICQVCGISNGFIEPAPDGWYEITTPEQLRYVSRSVVNTGNPHTRIRLMNDLDMSSVPNFPPIGIFDWPDGPQVAFKGEFDGQRHILYNLSIYNEDMQETGLFGRINDGGYIHDFGVVNASVTAVARAGIVAGEIHACQVNNVFTAGVLTIDTQNEQAAGIAGEAFQAVLNNCYSTFDGPLANAAGQLNNCYQGINAYEMAPTGQLCYQLNNQSFRNPTWFQTLGEDEFPILDPTHGIVYPSGEDEYASATTETEKAQMVNTLIANEIAKYEETVATKSLVENYIKKLSALKGSSLENYFTAYDNMAGLRAAIDESQQAYTAYTVQAQQALTTLESGGFEGDEVDQLREYLQEESEPSDEFENGSYPYIISVMELYADEVQEEIAKLTQMLDEAITKGYGTGSDITKKLQNPDLANGLDGWEAQGAVAATGQDGNINAIALRAPLAVGQTVSGLKPGLYEFRVGSYTDIGNWTQAGRYNYADGYVRAGDMLNHIKTQGSDLIPEEVYNSMNDEEKAQFVPITDESEFGNILGYKPSTVPGVCIGFRRGYWQNRIIANTDGELHVGLDFEGPADRQNIIFFGDAHLRYLGQLDSPECSEALSQTLAEQSQIASHIVYDYSADYYSTDAPNFSLSLSEELKATIAAAASAQTGEEKYKLIATFGDIFQRIWESQKLYAKLAQLNESVMKTCEEMMSGNTEEFEAYVFNVYEPLIEMFEKGEATNEEVAAKIGELQHNDIYMMQQGIEPEQAEDGFYLIADAYNLLWLSRQTNSGNRTVKARLVDDIDLSVFSAFPSLSLWRQDGMNGPAVDGTMFAGVIDGQGHVIKNMKIRQYEGYEAGFISRAWGATVRNLGFENPSIENVFPTWTGVLAGEFAFGTLENCWVSGNIEMEADPEKAGGFCGECAGSNVTGCWTTYEKFTNNGDFRTCFAGADVEAMKSTGELCFRLNGNQQNIVWYQTLGQDEYPVQDKSHAQVYVQGEVDCGGSIIGDFVYTNEQIPVTLPEHQYDETGLCVVCGDDLGRTTSDEDGYMLISNPYQMRYFASYVNSGNLTAKARLTEDIDMSAIGNFGMIGYYHWDNEAAARNFSGEIDGQGHVIRNLSVTVGERVEAGFCSRAYRAIFRNLGFENATITNTHSNGVRAGVLAGELHECTIINCWSCGDIQITTPHIQKSGLGGEAAFSNFTGCWTTYNTIGQMASSAVNTFWGDDVAAMHQSGELCYKLNGGKVTATEWRQNLGEDPYPVLDKTHKVVFLGEDGIYTNGNSSLPRQKGTIDDPFIIAEANDLVILPDYLNEGEMNYVRLATDLDMSNLSEWEPLCNETDYSFDFDGQGHVIRNLTCSGASANNSFFGNFHGNLRNVGFENMTVSDGGSTGMIAATVGNDEEETCIEHVYVDGQLTSGATFGGGMFGKVTGPTTIRNSYAHVVINSSSTYTGGIIGQVAGQLSMENVYAAGQASKGGGIVGGGQTADTPAAQYVNVAVWSNDYGIFGHTTRQDVKQGILFYDSTNFGEMQAAVVGWDNTVWSCDMAEGSYPVLIGLADAPYGVATIRVSTSGSEIYDLQGRRLSGKPARGIYIIGGKKVLVK